MARKRDMDRNRNMDTGSNRYKAGDHRMEEAVSEVSCQSEMAYIERNANQESDNAQAVR